MTDPGAAVLRNPRDGRLRAGWRIAAFVLLLMALAVSGQLGVRALLGGLRAGSDLAIAVVALAATVTVVVARRYLDKRSFASLGLTHPPRAAADLVFGFLLSGAMAGLVFGAMATTGLIEIHGVRWGVGAAARELSLALLPLVLVSWWEELVFRGYLLQNMIEGMGTRAAVAASCALYGLVHAFNPNAAVLSTLIIMLFGFLRIYGYLATGLLWLSLGMHAGWNFFQGPVFGYATSGVETEGLFLHVPSGPGWLTGGDFGPEGSALAIPAMVLALAGMRAWAGLRPRVEVARREG